MPVTFDAARSLPRAADAVGVPVYVEGAVPRSLGLNRSALAGLGFEGKVGQALTVPSGDGPLLVAVGMGPQGAVTTSSLRDAAAAFARAAQKRRWLATGLADVPGVPAAAAAQAVAEGVVLAGYRYVALKADKTVPAVERVTLVGAAGKLEALGAGAARGVVTAEAANLGRDLANTPPAYLTATDLAERALAIGAANGLQVDVFDEHQLADMGMGGILGVNQGSTEPPRLVRLTYTPRNPQAQVALVGKGVMYDSGGISLKPTAGMHVDMKMDMTGAAVVLATMSVLPVTKPRVKVVGYLGCTDNMPSGSAMKLGDVLTIRNGRTVEVHNTDAEGRLVLADALSLAVEDGADAIVDVATLTGACMTALGLRVAGLMGNDQSWMEQVRAAAGRADEPVWPLPLPPEYRKLLDSDVADMKNVGGPYGGALIAGLFLQEFVGDVPWAHLDIAGPMKVETDEAWRVKGASAFGVRTLVELLDSFVKPRR